MKRIDVVIGAGYGDEGKGLVTDCLSSDKSLVVRFNGGAQAGHTVQTPTQRHVFSHFGSGSFKHAPTFLSRFFVVNPTLFMKEAITLNAKISVPDLRVYVSSYAPVTTPFDVAINQVLERFRSGNRHGSCGIGFGETLERENFTGFTLNTSDIRDRERLREKLFSIFENYVPLRLQRLGITDEFLKTDDAWPFKTKQDVVKVIDDFINTVSLFNGLNFIKVYDDDQVLNAFDHLVFEGAQGLLLDQDYGRFPHVTRSNTGLKNVMDLLKNVDHSDINAHYLTRAYVTRHGAGPLENELLTKPYEHIEDETNIRNEFQGHLRFAYLNIKQYSDAVRNDVLKYGNGKITPSSIVTCCDHVNQSNLDFYDEYGNRKMDYIHHAIRRLANSIDAEDLYVSYGPTRNTLQKGPRHYIQSQ